MRSIFRGSSFLAAALVVAAGLPVVASPLAGLQTLGGTWKCTYRAGSTIFPYAATFADERAGRALREISSWKGGGDEELQAYDTQHARWTAVVIDDMGNTTVMRAPGSDPKHIAYRSVYPDASIAVTFDRTSPTQYTLHGTVRVGGKTITSVDTCLRGSP